MDRAARVIDIRDRNADHSRCSSSDVNARRICHQIEPPHLETPSTVEAATEWFAEPGVAVTVESFGDEGVR